MKFIQIAVADTQDTQYVQGGTTILALGEDGKVYLYCTETRALIDEKAAWVPLSDTVGKPTPQPPPQGKEMM